MTVHARLGGRNAGERRFLDRRVAIATVNPVAPYVALVAELNRLLARDELLGDPGRTIYLIEKPEEGCDEERGAEDADTCDGVRTTVEDLWHTPAEPSRTAKKAG